MFKNLDWRHWVLTHIVWFVAATIALVLGNSWLHEHDARILADTQIKISETTVAGLKQQIAVTDAVAAQKAQVITKIVHAVATPTQAVTAIPTLTDAPLNARIAPDSPTQVSVDAIALIQALGECKIASTELNACKSDLLNESNIVSAKDQEIIALRKKPSFWKRVESTLKVLGIGAGIGVALGARP
ncbi:MAG TPA: hypothetical protein VI386_22665 [Candidatus Sulfotelmatobacter sp.]